MKDVVVILMTVGFFALCVVYVALCDRIVGPDDQAIEGADPDAASGATAVATVGDTGDADPDPALVATGGTSVVTGAPEVTR